MASKKGSSHRQGQSKGRRHESGGTGQDLTSNYMENGEMNANLSERFRGSRYPNTHNSASTDQNNVLELNLSLDIRNYFLKQKEIKQSSKSDSWLALPEIPTFEELSIAETAVLPNKIDGPYKSKDRYLKTQYSLLREDAVGSLRDAILDFQKDPTTMDTPKFSVYDQVHISGFTFSRRGLAARIRFCTNRAGKKVSWMTTKRLTSGSIVALVRKKDKMSDLSGVMTAIVAARPLAGVLCQPPEIDIYFGRPEDIQIDPQEEWLMIEAKQGYYEAYRHTLQALQKLHQEQFPLSDNICQLIPANKLPDYIQQRPVLDFSAAAGAEQKKNYSKVDITAEWPPAPEHTLDESQWQAFREMFTKRLSIIQGPPGTGKTHVSKVAVHSLQDNRLPGDPPLIIAAQTNHALDQLLAHISQFDPNYVRLGGRSTNPEVKKRALFEVRQKERIKQIPGGMFGRTNSLLDKQAKALISILGPLTMPGPDPFSTDVTQSTTVLEKLGVLNALQAKSLEDGASQWVSTAPAGHEPLQLWLDTALTHFDFKYSDDNFGFPEVEDEDLEFEQLRETEDSTGVNDEEDIEMLKGPWAGIRDNVTVSSASSSDMARAEKLFATTNDLWKVPPHLRGPMYLVIRARALAAIANEFREAARKYDSLVKDILVGKWEQDYVYLKRARIIGMTTTGLSKYRALIAALKPRTILIEEAAEVLEAPVTVACVESLEHLILVGDHQQLRGHCSVSDLENEPFYLNMSLFERLVRNNMPYKTLLCQRRMNPEFRRLLASVYPALTDHPSVLNRPVDTWGMGTIKSFFFDHRWSEYKDASLSTYNEEEAKFIAGFYRHLQKNGVVPERITILTFYNGQRKRILKELRSLPDVTGTYHNVKTVDSYQGEENDIVILSMVRSNEDGKIGFLAIDNRVTVALSRAKYGFYLFGNAAALCKGSGLWTNVATIMSANPRRLHHQLPIWCQKHQTTVLVQYPEDFYLTQGGCGKDCGERQECGHVCPLVCHPYSHDDVKCFEDCHRDLPCGHGCNRKCSEGCFCPCKDFADLKRTELENRVKNLSLSALPDTPKETGEQDGGNISRGANDGQKFPAHGSTFYLPSQIPGLLDSPLILASDCMQTVSRPQSSPPKLVPRYRPTLEESTLFNPLSAKAQKQKQMGWSRFAQGGVKADDQRRAQSADPLQVHKPTSPPAMNAVQPSPVEHETSTEIKGGRTRFTHDYRPEIRTRAGRAEASGGSDGGVVVMQKGVEGMQAPPGSRENVASAAAIMDDLAHLDGYYRNS